MRVSRAVSTEKRSNRLNFAALSKSNRLARHGGERVHARMKAEHELHNLDL